MSRLRNFSSSILLIVGCGRAPSSHAPDITGGVDTLVIEAFDGPDAATPLSVPSLAIDSAGDPNQRPIHVWFVGSPGRRERVYAIGHADHACCPLVSAALFDTATHKSLRTSSWITFGVSDLDAKGDPSAMEKLNGLEDRLSELMMGSECRGQLFVHSLEHDEIARASDAVGEIARSAARVAAQEGRPIMVWYELPREVPALVHAYGLPMGSGGALPVEFALDSAELSFPRDVMGGVSLDGIGQHIASLKVHIKELQSVLQTRRALDGLTGHPIAYEMVSEVGYEMNYRDSGIGLRIRVALSRMEALDTQVRHHWNRVLKMMIEKGMSPPDDEFWQELDGYIATNRVALTKWKSLPPTPGPVTERIYFHEIDKPIHLPEGFSDALPTVSEISRGLTHAQRELARAKALRASPPPDPLPALIDTAIRGWPATFSSEKAEASYDRWTHERQPGVHALIDQRFGGGGYAFGLEDLLSYRVLFRAEASGQDDYRVRPVYVLNDGFYIVADPSTGLVIYESPNSDENLPKID